MNGVERVCQGLETFLSWLVRIDTLSWELVTYPTIQGLEDASCRYDADDL